MTQTEALRRLRELKAAGFETRDAAALFGTTIANTHMILRRLAMAGFIVHITRGSWGLVERVSRLALPQLVAAPYLAYVSLQSALFHPRRHCLICCTWHPAARVYLHAGRNWRFREGSDGRSSWMM